MKRPTLAVVPAVAAAIGFYCALLLALLSLEAQLVFRPWRGGETSPATLGLRYRDVPLVTRDGVRLSSWFVPGGEPSGGPDTGPRHGHGPRVLLFCHGNAGNLSNRLGRLRVLHGLGLSLLMFDYRGYGRSGGDPSEDGVYTDAEAAWDYLITDGGYRAEEIVVHGHSLGGAVAARVARVHAPGALILESSFTSAPDLAVHHFPLFAIRGLMRNRFDTIGALRRVTSPVLVVHSRDDAIVPFVLGRRLYAAAAPPKAFLEISGAHNSGFLTSGGRYTEGLRRFLAGIR